MANNIFEKLKKELPHLQKNVLLKNYTTFKIGGPALYFLVVKNKEELTQAIEVAKKYKLAVFVLGGGSNLLVSDKGFKGLVLKNEFTHLTLKSKSTIESGAGVFMKDLVNVSLENGLAGLEWAGGLPGTFGGAVRGNAGAFGGEMKDSILSVEVLDHKLNLKKLSNKQSQFSYRTSLFKKNQWSILSAVVTLKKGDKKKLKDIANSRIAYREEKHPLEYPNAGSVFKNVAVKSLPKKFQLEFADKVKQDPFPIVPTAWFIIGAGLTGKKIGRAQVSKKHSNYIVNLGGAKARDVLALIEFVKKVVKKKYGVVLEQEIQLLK